MSDGNGVIIVGRAGRAAGPPWGAIAFAALFPTALTLAYFVALADAPRAVVQGVYGVGKVVQFAFPALFVAWASGRFPRPARPRTRGAAVGVLFGLALLGGALLLYRFALAPSRLLEGAPADAIRAKLAAFGALTVPRYAALAAFYSLLHAAAEEYYWRWFVFGQLRSACGVGWAILVSSVAFAAHHVVILGTYLGWTSPWTAVGAAAVGAGGAFWAWLYDRSGSLVGPWLGHLMADAAIFSIGYLLVF